MNEKKRILILGLGNILMGDEGAGIKAIGFLKEKVLPDNVTLLDGGTGGFHLLHLFDEYDFIIFIDATINEKEPGKVSVITPKFSGDFPRTLASHDIGLRDLLQSAEMLGSMPESRLVTINIKDLRQVGTELTPVIEDAIPAVYPAVTGILQQVENI